MPAHETIFPSATSLIPSLLVACLSLGFSGVAAAAPPPSAPQGGGPGGAGPEEEACGGRAVGDACSLPNRQLGTCKAGTCNRLDYSGGSPPKAIEQACVVCQPAAGHGGPPSLGSGGAPSDSGGAVDPADSEGDDGGPSGSAGKEPPKSASRCRVDPDGAPLAGLGLLGVLGLLGTALRRRRRPRS